MGQWHDPSWRPANLWRDQLREQREAAVRDEHERRDRALWWSLRWLVIAAVLALGALVFAALAVLHAVP